MIFLFAIGMLLSNIAYAYTLDDLKKDYPKIKIKEESSRNDAGKVDNYRKVRLMKLGTNHSGLKLEFWLFEKNNYLKYVNVYATWYDYDWRFWNHITIGDGMKSYDIYPDWQPYREVEGRYVYEQLSFSIHDFDKWKLWSNAVQIRIKGDKYYNTFYMPSSEAYKGDMDIIRKYLWD